MAITLDAKTEVALTTNPQTIAHPTGTTNGDWLVLVAAGTGSSMALTAIDRARYRWVFTSLAVSSALQMLVGFKQFAAGDVAPSLSTASTGYAFMYRYSGVTSVRYTHQTPVSATTLDCPFTSAESGEEVVWVGAVRRSGLPDPTLTLSRGTIETNGTANFINLRSYREALGAAVTGVRATMTQTNTPSQAASASVVLSDKGAYVYKGRNTAADDTTGAA